MPRVRLLPSESRRRGLPAIGLDLIIADGVIPEPASGVVMPGLVTVLTERRPDGRRLGVLSIEVVAASLIIDRDGTLAQLANRRAPHTEPRPVTLEFGVDGYRVDVVRPDRVELPYQSWFALAPHDAGGSGAVIITLDLATPDWPAATTMLASLRLFSRDADARAVSDPGAAFVLPLVKPSGS